MSGVVALPDAAAQQFGAQAADLIFVKVQHRIAQHVGRCACERFQPVPRERVEHFCMILISHASLVLRYYARTTILTKYTEYRC